MTAYRAFKACKVADIKLAVQGNYLRWAAPPGNTMMPELKAQLVRVKPELMAMLNGDYARAGLELVLRETRPGENRQELVEMFDERLAICMVEGLLDYGQACQTAYLTIAEEIERIDAATAAKGRAA